MSLSPARADALRGARECGSVHAGEVPSVLIALNRGAFSYLLSDQAHLIRLCAEHP
jgi:hypothetical protein